VDFRAEGLLAAFPENLVGTRMLFPRAEVARELLPDELRGRGATVDVVTVYRTVKALGGNIGEILETERVDCIVFTSPSTIPEDLHMLPTGTALAVIGPVTREAALLVGLKPDVVPVESTIPALVTAIREHFR
jgi:uroporphyrinogen III methyltransferase/synthase